MLRKIIQRPAKCAIVLRHGVALRLIIVQQFSRLPVLIQQLLVQAAIKQDLLAQLQFVMIATRAIIKAQQIRVIRL